MVPWYSFVPTVNPTVGTSVSVGVFVCKLKSIPTLFRKQQLILDLISQVSLRFKLVFLPLRLYSLGSFSRSEVEVVRRVHPRDDVAATAATAYVCRLAVHLQAKKVLKQG